jgi:hypothetical protein
VQGNHKEAGNMGLLVHWLPSVRMVREAGPRPPHLSHLEGETQSLSCTPSPSGLAVCSEEVVRAVWSRRAVLSHATLTRNFQKFPTPTPNPGPEEVTTLYLVF